jgi:hypothetical protein
VALDHQKACGWYGLGIWFRWFERNSSGLVPKREQDFKKFYNGSHGEFE